jgi:hypothetical protein
MRWKGLTAVVAVVVCAAVVMGASPRSRVQQDADIPLVAWQGAPQFWTPTPQQPTEWGVEAQAAESSTPTVPMPYVAVVPCRYIDTRVVPYNPKFAVSETRTYTFWGECGIPEGALAVAANFTAQGYTIDGRLNAYPTDLTPVVTTLNYRTPATAMGNFAIVALDGTGQMSILSTQQTHAGDGDGELRDRCARRDGADEHPVDAADARHRGRRWVLRTGFHCRSDR